MSLFTSGRRAAKQAALLLFFQSFLFSTHAQVLSSRVYDFDSQDFFGDAIRTSDGNLLLTGDNRKDSPGFFIGKYHLSGNTIWSHRYEKGNDSKEGYVMEALLEIESGYLVAGYIHKKGLLLKYSKTGNFLWEKNFELDSEHLPRMKLSVMTRSANNKILISGLSGEGASPYTLIYISIDTNGNNAHLQWIGQQKDLEPIALLPMKDGGSILVTNSGSAYYDLHDIYPQVYRIDASDSVLWNKKLILPFNASVIDCILTTDHHLMMNGGGIDSASITGDGLDSAFIMKMDTLGNMIWLKTTSFKGIEPYFGLSALTETTTGHFLISGNGPTTSEYESFYTLMFEINENGDLIWTKKLKSPESGTTRFLKILPITQNKILWCGNGTIGNPWDPDEQNIYLIESDPAGNAACPTFDTTLNFNSSQLLYEIDDTPIVFLYPYIHTIDFYTEFPSISLSEGCPSELDSLISSYALEIKKEITVYPNPATDLVYFNLYSPTNRELKVYDVYGHLYAFEKVNAGKFSLNVLNWSEGIYFYFIDESAKHVSGKFEIMR